MALRASFSKCLGNRSKVLVNPGFVNISEIGQIILGQKETAGKTLFFFLIIIRKSIRLKLLRCHCRLLISEHTNGETAHGHGSEAMAGQ